MCVLCPVQLFENFSDDYVDFATIDLQAEYDKLNALLWKGGLKPVEMKWETIKHAAGRVISTRMKRKVGRSWQLYGPSTIQYLGMSNYFKMTYQEFINVLAHEQIHVHMIQNEISDFGGYHGVFFKKFMDDINSRGLGFNVVISDEKTIDTVVINNEKPLKTPIAFLLVGNDETGKTMGMPLVASNAKEAMALHTERVSYMAHMRKEDLRTEYIETRDPVAKLFPVARQYKTGKWYQIKPEIYSKLLEGGKIIKMLVTKKEEYMDMLYPKGSIAAARRDSGLY